MPAGQPQTPCSIFPPVQVIEALRLVQTPLTLVCPMAQTAFGVPVGVGVGVVTTTGVVVGVGTGVAVATGVGTLFGTHRPILPPTWYVVPGGHPPPWPIKRWQFGGVPNNGAGQVAAVTQFGGVPVWPGGQNRLLP